MLSCQKLEQEETLLIDFQQKDASFELFPKAPILSSYNSGWSGIHFEFHHQPSHDTPEHRLTMHTVCIAFNSTPSERWFDGYRQTEYQTVGATAIIPVGTLHRSLWFQDVQFMFLAIDPKLLVSLGAEVNLPDDIELIPQFATKKDPLLQGIFLAFKDELESINKGNNLYVEQLKTTLVIHLLKKYCVKQPQISIHNDGLPKYKLRQALEYINTHLNEDIKLADLAGVVAMSQFYFVRLFKHSMGVTPYHYVIQQRVEMAKQLLKQGKVTITDIALQCGFANQSHFTKHFRQLTGVTPKAYQKQ
ncbi:AraC family transcriptional regulator [Chlorogloeopsis sp. ULAP02]|uniref:AraC family transcriptional regulator n=1 Tax=Chlorogloeopsis sp. ULAP02 TaxID=3107926 RepID=UPI0031348818